MKSKHISMGLLFVLAALLMAACSGPSRVASTPVQLPGQGAGDQSSGVSGQPETVATDAPSQVETLIAVGDLSATQTAAAVESPADNVEAPPEPAATDAPEALSLEPTATPLPTSTPEPTPKPTDKPAVDCSSPYTVKKGDWVWDIGRRCNIDPNTIIAVNGLKYPYIIYAGDILVLPANAPPFVGP